MISIVDYGVGNLGSIANMLERVGCQSSFARSKEELEGAKKIILPGVGAFDYCMRSLNQSGMRESLDKLVVEKKIPVLGICLGAQMLGDKSDEGVEKGLGWIAMESKKFSNVLMRVPHMGWNFVEPLRDSVLFENTCDPQRFYFVHSYYMKPQQSECALATTVYGEKFTSIVAKNNIFGVQFHPEKSHRFGMNLLRNFVEKC